MEYIVNFFKNIADSVPRLLAFFIGAVWGLLEPTIYFGAICFFAIVLDCITAWRLDRRVKKAYPKQAKKDDGKFRSDYATKMFYTLLIVYACTFLGYLIDKVIYPFVDLYLANWIAGGFCLVQLVSILENESSCNGAHWAKVLQKVLVNKSARHLEIDPKDIEGDEEKGSNERKEDDDGRS